MSNKKIKENNMKKRHRIFIGSICIVLMIGVASFVCLANTAKDTKEEINDFVKMIEEHKVSKVEVYYYAWGDPATHTTEKELLSGKYEYKIINNLPSPEFLEMLKLVFSTIELPSIENKEYDCRLMFIFYDKDKELIRLSFSDSYPVVLINGQSCKAHSMLIIKLLPLLPKDAYDNVYSSMINSWFHR